QCGYRDRPPGWRDGRVRPARYRSASTRHGRRRAAAGASSSRPRPPTRRHGQRRIRPRSCSFPRRCNPHMGACPRREPFVPLKRPVKLIAFFACERTINNNKTSPGGTSMTITRLIALALAASTIILLSGRPSSAAELVYGSWTPAQEYQNRVAMPELFRNVEKDTGGAIKWKLIAGGQIADAKATFTAVKDGLMQGGLRTVTAVTPPSSAGSPADHTRPLS